MNPSNVALIISVLIVVIMLLVIWIEQAYRRMKEYERRVERLKSELLRQEAEQSGEASRKLEEAKKPITCNYCFCLINREHAFKVSSTTNHFGGSFNSDYYFCKACTPEYSRREITIDINNKQTIKYFKELEVTEEGKPVGYKKDK